MLVSSVVVRTHHHWDTVVCTVLARTTLPMMTIQSIVIVRFSLTVFVLYFYGITSFRKIILCIMFDQNISRNTFFKKKSNFNVQQWILIKKWRQKNTTQNRKENYVQHLKRKKLKWKLSHIRVMDCHRCDKLKKLRILDLIPLDMLEVDSQFVH